MMPKITHVLPLWFYYAFALQSELTTLWEDIEDDWYEDAGPLPMPIWLQNITNRTFWPDNTPPYIDLGMDLTENVPQMNMRLYGDCKIPSEQCSFDCGKCYYQTDIVTCPTLTQTFDDGPSALTYHLLDYFDEASKSEEAIALNRKISSTFFVIGTSVIRHPHLLRREYDSGHTICSHTWSHPFLPSISNEAIAAQIQWSLWAINATIGVVPRYFRPPFGGIDDRVRAIIEKFGLKVVLWDRDSHDWQLNLPLDAPNKNVNRYTLFEMIKGWLDKSKPDYNSTGMILQHDSTSKLIKLAIKVAKLIGPTNQSNFTECANISPDDVYKYDIPANFIINDNNEQHAKSKRSFSTFQKETSEIDDELLNTIQRNQLKKTIKSRYPRRQKSKNSQGSYRNNLRGKL